MGGMDMGDMDMDGMGASPSASASGGGMSMKFMLMGATSDLLGGDAGDVKYPYHLINGKVPADPDVYTGKPGRRVRLRFVNAGGATPRTGWRWAGTG
jgi:multicopper oxidase